MYFFFIVLQQMMYLFPTTHNWGGCESDFFFRGCEFLRLVTTYSKILLILETLHTPSKWGARIKKHVH